MHGPRAWPTLPAADHPVELRDAINRSGDDVHAVGIKDLVIWGQGIPKAVDVFIAVADFSQIDRPQQRLGRNESRRRRRL